MSLSFTEPREQRRAKLEEMHDLKSYERQKLNFSNNSNKDVIALISALGMLFSMNNQGSGRQYFNRGPHNMSNGGGHNMSGNFAQHQAQRGYGNGANQHGRYQNGH